MSVLFQTERLLLREFTLDDAEALFELNADPEVIRYTGDSPFESINGARAFLEQYDAYRLTGMGRWMVTRVSDGAVLGWCGLKSEQNEVDLGYRLHRRFWGQGYATEAAMACLEYGFHSLKLESIIGRVVAENTASRSVLLKCGMVFEQNVDCHQHPALQFRIRKLDFHPTKTYSFVPSQKQ